MKLDEFGEQLTAEVPLEYAEDWDNVGWMVKPDDCELTGVLACVDVDSAALEQALETGSNLLLAHHPLLFKPLEQLVETEPHGELLYRAVREELGIFTLHTNADACSGGLNDLFGDYLGLRNLTPLVEKEEQPEVGLGRVGQFNSPVALAEVESRLRARPEINFLRSIGSPDTKIRRVAFCTGSGGDFVGRSPVREADLYISGDLKHHEVEAARMHNTDLIVLDHYEMETFFLDFARELLNEKIDPSVELNCFRRENPYRHSIRPETLSSWEEKV